LTTWRVAVNSGADDCVGVSSREQLDDCLDKRERGHSGAECARCDSRRKVSCADAWRDGVEICVELLTECLRAV
jgi:hypothetical protein